MIDSGSSIKDLRDFFNDRKIFATSIIFRSLSWETKYPRFLIARMLAFHGWVRGHFSLGDFLRLQLPRRFKSQTLRDRFSSFLNAEAMGLMGGFIAADGAVVYHGNRFYPSDGNYHELLVVFFEVVVSDQYQARRFLKEDSVIIDAGANIGIFSIFGAHCSPRGQVYAFEPARATFDILRKNAAPYSGISCFKAGLGDARSAKDILTYPRSTCGSTFEDSGILSLRHHRPEDLERERVDVVTIDGFVADRKIPRVDFIKIDTEGYEARILEGAKETIRTWKPVIAMSAYHHPHDKKNLPRLLAELCPTYVCDLRRDCEEDLICHAE